VSITWIVIRASGIVAYALLSASVAWGLYISTGLFGRSVRAKGLNYAHESLAIAALLATAAHVVALTMDQYVTFSAAQVMVPGLATWRPGAVALGIVALWLTLIVAASFYVRPRIGQKAWRAVHYASFGAFGAAAWHGLAAGTDSQDPVIFYMYVASIALVAGLTAVRVVGLPRERASARSERGLDRRTAQRGAPNGQAATRTGGGPPDDVEAQPRRLRPAGSPPRNEPVREAAATVLDPQGDEVRAGVEAHAKS
jgi:sulfoxide reductase heme-binding subunit YedZ